MEIAIYGRPKGECQRLNRKRDYTVYFRLRKVMSWSNASAPIMNVQHTQTQGQHVTGECLPGIKLFRVQCFQKDVI